MCRDRQFPRFIFGEVVGPDLHADIVTKQKYVPKTRRQLFESFRDHGQILGRDLPVDFHLKPRQPLRCTLARKASLQAFGFLCLPELRPADIYALPLEIRPKPYLHEIAAIILGKQLLDHAQLNVALQILTVLRAKSPEFPTEVRIAALQKFPKQVVPNPLIAVPDSATDEVDESFGG